MNMLEKIKRYANSKKTMKEYAAYSRYNPKYDYDADLFNIMRSNDANFVYAYMHHYFHHRAPKFLREHREYFKQEQRGFGEDAFHAMWWLLLLSLKPEAMLEIGIYRGQTMTLWGTISKYLHHPVAIHGISPFAPIGDSVSTYLREIDYYEDVLESFRHWGLEKPGLLRALSTDEAALDYIHNRKWDLIFIDGSHDYEVVKSDFKHCLDSLAKGGLLVMDDAGLGSSFTAPGFSFAGHPGPSRVACEIAQEEMDLVGFVGHNAIFMKK